MEKNNTRQTAPGATGQALAEEEEPCAIAASPKRINVATRGVMALAPSTREKAVVRFHQAVNQKDDWLYAFKVDGQEFFAAANGEGGYTLMLRDEY